MGMQANMNPDRDCSESNILKEKEERLKREELERFEKSLRGTKKRGGRNRNRHSETVEVGFLEKHRATALMGFTALVTITIGIWIMME